jgi:3-carboxy-cis,cis-muconate cycloisomerase
VSGPVLEEADRTLDAAVRSLARHAREHRMTPMLGRTLMQPAVAMSAGVKVARWALALAQDRERLADAQGVALAVSWGGAVGTQQGLGERGIAARKRLARRLGLEDAPAWHVHRNAWIDLLDRLASSCSPAERSRSTSRSCRRAKSARCASRRPQEGVGGSSAMPHKRNPVGCMHALAAATRVPGLLAGLHAAALPEHERSLGRWQAELALVPDIVSALGSSLDFLDTIAGSLVIDAARMKANLEAYGAPGTTIAADGGTMDELLEHLGPYVS